MRTLFVNLGLLLVSCLVGLSLCEVSLRLFHPKYRDLAEAQFQHHAARIWARTPNSRDWAYHPDTFRLHFLHHNNLALRQHRNFTEAELVSATNVGVFGDSFVENIRMAAQYSFTEPLDYLLNQSGTPFNVLNFGVYGYGPGQSLLHYETFRYVDDLDHVFFVYCENDLWNLHATGLFHLDDTGHLVRREASRSSWWVSLISRLHTSYLVLDADRRWASFLAEPAGTGEYPRGEQDLRHQRHRAMKRAFRGERPDEYSHENSLEIFRQVIRRWKHLAEYNGSTFSVVLLPVAPAWPPVVDLLNAEDVEVIDLYACFTDADPTHPRRRWPSSTKGGRSLWSVDPTHPRQRWPRSPYRFNKDEHWNEAGNRLAAVCLYRVLEERLGLPRLAEDRLQEALFKYYVACGGEIPPQAGVRRAEGPDASETAAAAIREKYLALDLPEFFQDLKDEIRKVAAQPAKRIIRSVFDVYLDGNQLIYVKEGCRPTADTRARFFVHVTPVDDGDLPEDRRQYGFESRNFSRAGLALDAQRCAVRSWLPDYPIRRLATGQFVRDDEGNYVHLWEGEFVMEQGAGAGGEGDGG